MVGGGLVGLSMGTALASAGVEVAVIDAQAPDVLAAAPYDGRASAIARGSRRILEGAGVWQELQEAQPIVDIRVSDGRIGRPAPPLFLHFDAEEVDGEPMGWIVENRLLRAALDARAAALPSLVRIAPAKVAETERGNRWAEVRLEDGRALRAELLIAADGRNSRLRQAAGIAARVVDYPQAGLVCTLLHERPHHGTAHEHFLPSGPFAVLPMTDGPGGAHRSSLVWTEKRALTDWAMKLDPAAFAGEVQRRFGDSLGKFELEGRRWSYPLSVLLAARGTDRRLALIGDAAHVIHPIAGQGFNLGLRDVAALAECIVDRRRLGLDLGAAEALDRYARWRRFDTLTLTAVTDGLNRLFSSDLPPIRAARDLGLATVNRIGPLRRFFMHHAMGLSGDLPRLARGEPL